MGLSGESGAESFKEMSVSGLTPLAPGAGEALVTISSTGLPWRSVGVGEAAAVGECVCAPTSRIEAATTAAATATMAPTSQVARWLVGRRCMR